MIKKIQLKPRKNNEFSAVLWRLEDDYESIWLDDIEAIGSEPQEEWNPLSDAAGVYQNQVEETAEHLSKGMSLLFIGDITEIDDRVHYLVHLGTYHPEHFVTDFTYAVDTFSYPPQVYRLNVLNNQWEPVPV